MIGEIFREMKEDFLEDVKTKKSIFKLSRFCLKIFIKTKISCTTTMAEEAVKEVIFGGLCGLAAGYEN